MFRTMPRSTRAGVLAPLCAAAAVSIAAAGATQTLTAPTTYSSSLTDPRVSRQDGAIILSVDVTGELRGTATFKLVPDATDPGKATGRWGLAVGYAENVPESEAPAPPPLQYYIDTGFIPEDHRDLMRLVNKGIVGGDITAATLRYSEAGTLSSIDAVQLRIVSASLSFEGATGTGAIGGIALTPNALPATLTLTLIPRSAGSEGGAK